MPPCCPVPAPVPTGRPPSGPPSRCDPADEQAVHRWLAQNARVRLTLEAAWPSREEPVGRVQPEGDLLAGRGPVDVRAPRVVLRREPASPLGFVVQTTVPFTCRGRTHMSMKPPELDRRYGELDQVMRACLGQPADDTPERRSRAPDAHLRHTWHTRPAAVAEAEGHLRAYE